MYKIYSNNQLIHSGFATLHCAMWITQGCDDWQIKKNNKLIARSRRA